MFITLKFTIIIYCRTELDKKLLEEYELKREKLLIK